MIDEKKYFTLKNGLRIPNVCLGTDITYPAFRKGRTENNIKAAYSFLRGIIFGDKSDNRRLKISWNIKKVIKKSVGNGCVFFDTSRAYGGSEYRLGQGLKSQKRENFFIATKLNNINQFKGKVIEAFEESLEELDMKYVDLYLLHWPVSYPAMSFAGEQKEEDVPLFVRSWKYMEYLYESGKCRAIGVCNFDISHLEILKKHAKIMPMVDQFECHPLFTRDNLIKYCQKDGIQVISYASLCRMDSRLMTGAILKIAKKYQKTPAQIILRWHVQRGCIPVFNTSKVDRMMEGVDIYDFALNDEEINQISSYDINYRFFPDSNNCDFSKL
jgi:diketogulonate reductase-like aldo/keto reductase